jgi:FkbM family methyltransferase
VVAIIARSFGVRNEADFGLPDGRRLRLGLFDGYWIPWALRGASYEPEIELLLSRLLGPSVAFIDCGANVGWWSTYAGARVRRREHVVAVEASSDLYRRLSVNAGLNGSSYTPVHAAVWHSSGEHVTLATDVHRHAWGSISGDMRAPLDQAGFSLELVPTVTVDELVARMAEPPSRILLKLDVEGVEIDVLRGAVHTLERDTLVIFEDHGRDPSCAVSRFLLEDLHMAVFHSDDSGRLIPLVRVAEVKALKRDSSRGYNLFACRAGGALHAELAGPAAP